MLSAASEFEEFELIKPIDSSRGRCQGGRQIGTWPEALWLKQAIDAVAGSNMSRRRLQPLDLLLLGRLKVDNGTILYDDLVSDTREEMTAVDLDINWPSASAPVGGRGTLHWRGETIEFTGLLATPLELIRGGRSTARFAIASTPLRASFSGTATSAATAPP